MLPVTCADLGVVLAVSSPALTGLAKELADEKCFSLSLGARSAGYTELVLRLLRRDSLPLYILDMTDSD